jgi:hypothetical protein
MNDTETKDMFTPTLENIKKFNSLIKNPSVFSEDDLSNLFLMIHERSAQIPRMVFQLLLVDGVSEEDKEEYTDGIQQILTLLIERVISGATMLLLYQGLDLIIKNVIDFNELLGTHIKKIEERVLLTQLIRLTDKE